MTGLLNWLSQVIAVTEFSLRTLPQRKGSAASAVFGIAGVVAVLVGVLSIAQGIVRMMESSSDPENAIVLRTGATSEMMSGFSNEWARIISEAPGVSRQADMTMASSELFVIINLPLRSTGTDANVPLRGVVPAAFEVRDRFRMIEGRPFRWGLSEVIVGVAASRQFAGLELGSSIEVGQERWPIVGIFAAGGGIAESEIWTDAKVLQPAFRRGDSYQAVYAKLRTPAAFQNFKDALTTDPRLSVKPLREDEYYASQSTMLVNMITGLGTLVAGLMGLGALFGALNTMYTAVSARSREIATLRALGFRGGPIVLSVLFEALVLALLGGAIGGLGAYFAFDGFRTATMNWSSFSQIAFAFDVNARLLIQGVVYAAILGLIGGLFPALRAARLPVAQALHEL